MSDAIGVSVVVDLPDFAAVQGRLERLTNLQLDELMDGIGGEVADQSRRRIQHEKTGPDGVAWVEWSEKYAETRHRGQSLLQAEGDLVDSIQHEVRPDGVEIGSNLIYARIHQLGGEPVDIPIPARPYLGLSKENEDDVLALVNAHFVNLGWS